MITVRTFDRFKALALAAGLTFGASAQNQAPRIVDSGGLHQPSRRVHNNSSSVKPSKPDPFVSMDPELRRRYTTDEFQKVTRMKPSPQASVPPADKEGYIVIIGSKGQSTDMTSDELKRIFAEALTYSGQKVPFKHNRFIYNGHSLVDIFRGRFQEPQTGYVAAECTIQGTGFVGFCSKEKILEMCNDLGFRLPD